MLLSNEEPHTPITDVRDAADQQNAEFEELLVIETHIVACRRNLAVGDTDSLVFLYISAVIRPTVSCHSSYK